MVHATDHAWTAGMIDADGSLTYQLSRPDRPHTWRPLVVVDNTDIEILHELKRLHGGGKLTEKRKQAPHHRQAWSWRLYGADVIIDFLSRVEPYMHCGSKKARAGIILDEYRPLTPRNGYYTDDMKLAKVALFDRYKSIGSGRGSQCKPGDLSGLGPGPVASGWAS
ncbi:HNH endonuclease [Gordonia phage WilliamBoone]|nr:HNH endonuclease [Gordonia phage WilliamBoone]